MRVARIVQLARLTQPEWLFPRCLGLRADLALGGDDESDPPSSACSGVSSMGKRTCRRHLLVADPIDFAYHLWKVVSITAIGVRTDWGWFMICALCNCLGRSRW